MANIKYTNKWAGYTNFADITNMPINILAAGSQNTFITDGEKLEPRAGMAYLGVAGTEGVQTNAYWTLAHRIHSKYDEFVNKWGIKMPIRVFYSGTTAVGDVMEVYLPVYSAGVATSTKQWYQITATAPTLPIVSTHRYYFAEWFDGALNVLQPELIFTYGSNKIGNYSGGFAPITAIGATTITTNDIWDAKGFIWGPEGANIININVGGVITQYTVTAGFGTNTLTIGATAGITVDSLAFQNVYFQIPFNNGTPPIAMTGSTFDVCSAINNQVYYIDWNQRNVYVSWNRNQVANIGTTLFNGTGLNDGIFSGTFTGTSNETYRVSINSVKPDINEQVFVGSGINDGIYDTTLYTLVTIEPNVYTVTIAADFFIGLTGVGAPQFTIGETVIGAVSGAEGIVVAIINPFGNDQLAIKMLTSNQFIGFPAGAGEIITGQTSGTARQITGQAIYLSWFQYSKNGVTIPLNVGFGLNTINPIFPSVVINLTDNLDIKFGDTNVGRDVGDTYTLTIRKGGIDTFTYAVNGGALSGPINITTGAQALGNGVFITFANINGHTIGDLWQALAIPTVIRGWSDFTYTNPDRLPGQGYTLLLDSNGWTMKPQEKTMLINAQAGHFYDAENKLSANLLSETIQVTRLKSEPQNKILFPYLINYIKNQLATISQEKTFDVLGRQKFLELQQSKTISDAVRIDFETVDWTDADILYFKRKIYFNIPRKTAEGIGACIFVWDDYKKYWHTPQVFGKRISLLSIIDDMLIGHSYEQNESYQLFTGLNDLGIFPIETKIVVPYDSNGARYFEKSTDAIGFEGYILGNPVISWTVNADVGGCGGQRMGVISPQDTKKGLCLPIDKASLGKSSLGFHGLGNDPVDVIPHFFYIKPFPSMMYYQRNIEITCNSLEQRWSLISFGTSVENDKINNVSITDPN